MKRAFWLAMVWVGFLGCAPQTRLIATGRQKEPVVSKKDSATLIVSNVMNWPVVNLLDQNGMLVGQLTKRSHTVIHRPAGAFKLYALPERMSAGGDRIEGKLEAGKVYYVQIAMRWGGASMIVLAQRLDSEEWNNRKTYVSELDRVDMDRTQLPGLVEDLGDGKQLVTEVDEVVAGFEQEAKSKRLVQPGDGETL